MYEDFILEWVWVMFIDNKLVTKIQNYVYLCFKFYQGRNTQKTQRQLRNLYHCQVCLTSISSHWWSWKWHQVLQWMAVLWKWWDVKQSVKRSFLPKVIIFFFFFGELTYRYPCTLPFMCDLHGVKEEEKHKRNTGVRDKYILPPRNLNWITARSKWQKRFYMEIWCSSGVCSTFLPLNPLSSMLMKPGCLYLNCTKELNIKIYNIFLSHLYFYKLFITPVIFLINALNGLYLSVKLKTVHDLFQMYFDRIT